MSNAARPEGLNDETLDSVAGGEKPAQAYFVRTDRTTMTSAIRRQQGQVLTDSDWND